MVILGPVGRHALEKFDHPWKAKLLVPAFAQLRDSLRHAHRVIVVDDVARADEEVRAQLQHRLERRETEALVRFRGGQRPAGFPLSAVHEFVVVHATADDEARRRIMFSARQRFEGTARPGLRRRLRAAINGAIVVGGIGLQAGELRPHDEVASVRSGLERCAPRFPEILAWAPLETRDAWRAGQVAVRVELHGRGQPRLQQRSGIGDLAAQASLTKEDEF